MSFPVSNVFLESPWPTVIFISVTMSPELNIRIMYLILLDVLTPIYICQILWLFKCSPDWLLNFFTGGFGDLLESYGDDFLETWGISLRPLFKNAFDFCSTKPFLLLGEFFRCPSRTSGWLPVTEVTIVGNGSGCLVVVRCVVVDLVGGGPHIKSEVKK